MEDKKRYNAFESVLQEILKKFVSLSDEDIKRNNNILKAIVNLMVEKMKQKDILFKEMYTRVFFGGSYYDGLRVGQPDEFDLDLLLCLPKLTEPVVKTSNKPGFVHLQLDYAKFQKQPNMVARYKGLDKLIDESNYLDTTKVLRWMERVVNLALNDFEKKNNEYILKTPDGILLAKVCKGGPAFTLKVHGNIIGKDISMDVDLVPCFVFGKDKWPKNGFRPNPITKKPDYFIVPKPIKDVSKGGRYWRLSFQEQERLIIDAKGPLKPSVKLLKKMRDTLEHKCIASYYIKTVVIWSAFDKNNAALWTNSLSYVFMNVLKEYYNCLKSGKIQYFWNKNNNLLKNVNEITISNMSNRIKAVIDDIEKHLDDPLIIAKYLLKGPELRDFLSGRPSNPEVTILLSKRKL